MTVLTNGGNPTAAVLDSGTIVPGSVVVVRDEEWLVRSTEQTTDGLLVHVQGLGELVRETEASFYASLDTIVPLDPAETKVVPDDSQQYRTSRLWLESTIRKTAVPLAEEGPTVSTRALADVLSYQQTAVRKALDPSNLRPRIPLADAIGLGKTLGTGTILSELVRRGRGERILSVAPRHVLEQMQHEMWSRFALPFVRLDSSGIQRVRQKLPATRNPFAFYRRMTLEPRARRCAARTRSRSVRMAELSGPIANTVGLVSEPWVSADAIAEHLGATKDSVYAWIANKGMPAHRVGRLWKFQVAEVDAWVRRDSGDTQASSARGD